MFPPSLHNADVERWLGEVANYYAISRDERHRRRAPVAKRWLEDSEVIDAVSRVFHGKCAYCESAAFLPQEGHISHYRPPSNAAQLEGVDDSPDHYGWLALEWNNLLFLCTKCFYTKSNLFPVLGALAEPMTPWKSLAKIERPLLLDPCTDSPSMHLGFSPRGRAYPLSLRGAATIEIMQLNRKELCDQRAAAIRMLLRALAQPGREDAFRAKVRELTASPSAFSGVLATYLIQICRRIESKHGGRDFRTGFNLDSRVWTLRRRSRPSAWAGYLIEHEPAKDPERFRAAFASLAVPRPAVLNEFTPISNLRISGFKGIEQLSLSLRSARTPSGQAPCMMLLGENASGKSTILQAIAFALMSQQEGELCALNRADLANRHATKWDEATEVSLEVQLSFGPGERLSKLWVPERDYPQWTASSLDHPDNLPVLGYGAHRLVAPNGKGGRSRSLIASLFNPFKPLPHPEKWLGTIDEHLFDAVARALRIILSLGPDDDIYRAADGQVLVRAARRVTPLDRLSDGYKSLLAMSVDIMRNLLAKRSDLEYARGVVLIDEIENHLHPRWKMRVVSALRESMPMVQFIVTTHDPLCLRGMFDGEVKVVFRNGAGAIDVIEDLPDISTLRVDQLLTSDFFGLDSATDPERDAMIRELAELAGIPDGSLSTEQAARRDEILSASLALPVIGSSIDRHIVAEAVSRHLRDGRHSDPFVRRNARESSVRQIMDVLRRSERT